MTINEKVLIDAIAGNLFPAGNAGVVEVALAALGHAELGYRCAVDMTRLAETKALYNAATDEHGPELERRTGEFWETVAQVKQVVGIAEAA